MLLEAERTFEVQVQYIGEYGSDHGGVFRDWVLELSRVLFSKELGFFYRDESGYTRVSVQTNFLSNDIKYVFLKAAGVLLAIAFRHGLSLGLKFPSLFLESLCGAPLNVNLFEQVDYEAFHRFNHIGGIRTSKAPPESLQHLRDAVEPRGFIDSVSVPFGKFIQVNLPHNTDYRGKSDANLTTTVQWREWSRRMLKHRATLETAPTQLVDGFRHFVSEPVTTDALRDAFAGVLDLPIDEWRANTVIINETNDARSQSVNLFWQAVAQLDAKQKLALLNHWAAMAALPVGGFANIRASLGKPLQIFIDDRPCPRLLVAQTCNFLLNIPTTDSLDDMRTSLNLTLKQGLSFGTA